MTGTEMTEQTVVNGEHAPERRQYQRVQDAVALHIERLTDRPAAGQPGSTAPSESGRQGVRKHDKYEIEGYAEVRRNHPAVADYIDALEERIRELLLGGEQAQSVKPTHKVSLSAGGMSFSDKLLLQPGEVVAVTMTLFPSGQRIGTDAVVIAGNDSPEVANSDAPNYRLRFVRMSDADRECIAAHVTHLLGNRTQFTD